MSPSAFESDRPFWSRLLPLACAAAAVCSAAELMFRMLWFDEVLTVNLVVRLPLSRIYFAYEIPNNHIVFTLLEKIWYGLVNAVTGFSYIYFRLVPMVCAGIAVFLLARKLIRSCGLLTGALVPAVFAASPVFAMYATAIRGYMLGFLLTVLALLSAEKVIRRGGFRSGLVYFLTVLLSLGTAPTNLAALAGVVLYYLPRGVRAGRRGVLRLVFLSAAPLVALILFYLPIFDKFLGCIRLGEGWPSASSAIYAFYTGALFPLGLLLICCLPGAVRIWRHFPRLRLNCLCGLAILLLPLAAYLVMKVPPFPRVFFPLLAVWLMLAAHTLDAGLKNFRHSSPRLAAGTFAAMGLISAFLLRFDPEAFGDRLYGSGGRNDDYIAPYYARAAFQPEKLLKYLKETAGTEGYHVFVTFDADAPSVLFAASILDFPEHLLHADTLNRPKTFRLQDYPGTKYLICETPDDLKRTLGRFDFKSAVLLRAFGRQNLYLVTE